MFLPLCMQLVNVWPIRHVDTSYVYGSAQYTYGKPYPFILIWVTPCAYRKYAERAKKLCGSFRDLLQINSLTDPLAVKSHCNAVGYMRATLGLGICWSASHTGVGGATSCLLLAACWSGSGTLKPYYILYHTNQTIYVNSCAILWVKIRKDELETSRILKVQSRSRLETSRIHKFW